MYLLYGKIITGSGGAWAEAWNHQIFESALTTLNYQNSNNYCGHLYIVLPLKLKEKLVFRNYISEHNTKGKRARLHLNLGHYTTTTGWQLVNSFIDMIYQLY